MVFLLFQVVQAAHRGKQGLLSRGVGIECRRLGAGGVLGGEEVVAHAVDDAVLCHEIHSSVRIVGDISDYAYAAVYFMAKNGIINGMGNNLFAPKNTTSAQAAAFYANATREQALLTSVRSLNNLK